MGWNGRQGVKNHEILREASNTFGENTKSLSNVVAEAMEKEKFTQDFQGTRWIDSLFHMREQWERESKDNDIERANFCYDEFRTGRQTRGVSP